LTDGRSPCCVPGACLDISFGTCYHCRVGQLIRQSSWCSETPPSCQASYVTVPGTDSFILTPEIVYEQAKLLDCPLGYSGQVVVECGHEGTEVKVSNCRASALRGAAVRMGEAALRDDLPINNCTCPRGRAVRGALCPSNGTVFCRECDPGYMLDPSSMGCVQRAPEADLTPDCVTAGVYYRGDEISRQSPSGSWGACQTQCRNTGGCTCFSFWGETGMCIMQGANATFVNSMELCYPGMCHGKAVVSGLALCDASWNGSSTP
jgi:hypothetical protein